MDNMSMLEAQIPQHPEHLTCDQWLRLTSDIPQLPRLEQQPRDSWSGGIAYVLTPELCQAGGPSEKHYYLTMWILGDTYRHREQFRRAGYRWNGEAWSRARDPRLTIRTNGAAVYWSVDPLIGAPRP